MDGPKSESLASNGARRDPSIPEEKYDPKYAKLYQAVRSGDLEATREFLNEHPQAVTARISTEGKLPLHVAALFGHLHIMKELLQRLSVEDVALLDFKHLTALHEAVFSRIDVAQCLIEKNSNLLTLSKEHHMIPVTRALGAGRIEMVRYLYSVTPREALTPEYGKHGATLLNLCYYSRLLDVALDLLDNCPSLSVTPDRRGKTFLEALATIPSAFPSGCQLSFWQRWIYNRIDIKKEQLRMFDREVQHKPIQPKFANKDITVNMPLSTTGPSDDMIRTTEKSDNMKLSSAGLSHRARRVVRNALYLLGINNIFEARLAYKQYLELLHAACNVISTLNEDEMNISKIAKVVLVAAQRGNPDFIVEAVKVKLSFLWTKDDEEKSLFHLAIEFRQENVFSLIHGLALKHVVANFRDKHGNSLLHMAGLLAPSMKLNHISGALLQMQRELQWFKEVERIMPPMKKESLNNANFTARELFTKHHEDLVKKGEEWTKGTANSCSVVAALVATITFAAIFTVPGGNDQNNGDPIFLKKKLFLAFAISNAVSLFSSSTSLLMFLGLLTSRYAEDDFLMSLPTKLIIGLSTMFFSIATMMIAFCAGLFLMLRNQYPWIVIPVTVLASVPVTLYIFLQFPLLVEIYNSTFGRGIFCRNVKHWP